MRQILLSLPLLAACAADPASRLDTAGAFPGPADPASEAGILDVLAVRPWPDGSWAVLVRATDPAGPAPAILGAWTGGRPWPVVPIRPGAPCGDAPCPALATGAVLLSPEMARRVAGPGGDTLLVMGEETDFRGRIPGSLLPGSSGG